MKKKLLVILGAGCSVACGMPSFADLDQSMRHWAELWANAREWQNYYEALWTDIKNYYKTERSGPHYNLNYDTVALTAWPRAYVGFASSGKFDARAIHRRRKWNFIYHLHGSVHHSLIGAFMEQMEWREDLGGTFNDGPENLNHRLDGKSLPKTTLIAGGYKLEQLLAEPFHSFHAALVRHLYEAKAILIGGYGFADEHVNRALRNRLLNAADNDRPRVAVIDYGQNKNTSAEFSNDPWDHYLCTSLNISRLSTPKPPSEFAAAKEFEIPNPRVTIWYSGFIQAADRIGSIIDWLSGAGTKI